MTQAAFFDIDGTLVGGHTWSGILAYPQMPRARVWRFYLTQLPNGLGRALRVIAQERFRDDWAHGLAWLVRGWEPAAVDALGVWVAGAYLAGRYRADVVERLRAHKAEGIPVILVSTILQPVAAQIAAHLGADAGLGSVLAFEGGRCTGRLASAPCTGARKVPVLQAYLDAQGIGLDWEQAAAYADSGSDVPLLAAVGQPVAVYPDDELLAEVGRRGWSMLP